MNAREEILQLVDEHNLLDVRILEKPRGSVFK